MLLAKLQDERVSPKPGTRALCPSCGGDVLAKCGETNVWHWAHVSADCDPWSEPETGWHYWWKRCFPPANQEVIIGCHRADVVTPKGMVLEIQHSTISAKDIRAREEHYGPRMMWLLDMRERRENLGIRPKGDYVTFRWLHPKRSFFASQRMVAMDLGGKVLVAKKIHPETPCGGWGKLMSVSEFLVSLNADRREAILVEDAWRDYERKQRISVIDFVGDYTSVNAAMRLAAKHSRGRRSVALLSQDDYLSAGEP